MDAAATVMERMDHKNTLYNHLGRTAMVYVQHGQMSKAERLDENGNDVVLPMMVRTQDAISRNITRTGQVPRPRTRVERYMDKRIEARGFKKEVEDAKRAFVKGAYTTEKASTLGLATKIADAGRRRGVNQGYREGDLTAQERRDGMRIVDATPTGFRNGPQNKVTESGRIADTGLARAVEQPTLSKWRGAMPQPQPKEAPQRWTGRQGRAIGRIQKYHAMAERQRQAREARAAAEAAEANQ